MNSKFNIGDTVIRTIGSSLSGKPERRLGYLFIIENKLFADHTIQYSICKNDVVHNDKCLRPATLLDILNYSLLCELGL